MARRSEHSKEDLQKIAIQAGIELIEEKGFSQFSARAVAGKMGYTVGTLYHLFGTLDDFILQINGTTLDMCYESLERGMRVRKGNIIHYLARGYLQFARLHYQRWQALFLHHLQEGKVTPDWYAAKTSQFHALVVEALLPHTNDDIEQAKHLSKVLWASIHGVCVLALSGKLEMAGTSDSAEALLVTLVDTTLAGIEHDQSIRAYA